MSAAVVTALHIPALDTQVSSFSILLLAHVTLKVLLRGVSSVIDVGSHGTQGGFEHDGSEDGFTFLIVLFFFPLKYSKFCFPDNSHASTCTAVPRASDLHFPFS